MQKKIKKVAIFHRNCGIDQKLSYLNFFPPSFLEPIKEDTPAQVAPEAPAATKSSYVPPHLRNSAANSAVSAPSATGAARPGGPRRMKHAPDINSEVYFPSLSAAMGTDDPNHGQGQANR